MELARSEMGDGGTAQGGIAPPLDEMGRVKIFIGIQVFFLLVSCVTGGFQFRAWSMLDSALLIQSLGVSGLILVLDSAAARRRAFQVAMALYVLAVLDMGINVILSGIVGWHSAAVPA
jgi:hypothetical protein